MAWNGSGTFTRTNGTNTGTETWQDDAAAATKIRADRHDTHDQDLAAGIDACITQNNESKPTAHFLPNVDATYNMGSASYQWGAGYFTGLNVNTKNVATKLLLEEEVISGTPSTIAFTELDDTYEEYIIDLHLVRVTSTTNDTPLELQFGTGGASPSWLAAGSHYMIGAEIGNLGITGVSGNGNDGVEISSRAETETANWPHVCGEVSVRNIGTGDVAVGMFSTSHVGNASRRIRTDGVLFAETTGTYTAMRLISNGTTFAAGTVRLYGVVK